MKKALVVVFSVFTLLFLVFGRPLRILSTERFLRTWNQSYSPHPAFAASGDSFFDKLSSAAIERTKQTVRYDGAYMKIPYPNGDVPASIGVCSDEVVRSYRALGIDLQQLVHEDMKKSFREYPKLWGLREPDSSIDHRRVPNLMHFFQKYGTSLKVTDDPDHYTPGDLVVWRLYNGLLHIGLVVSGKSEDGKRPLIVHNIGAGPQREDALFVGEIVAHFRFKPKGWTDSTMLAVG